MSYIQHRKYTRWQS